MGSPAENDNNSTNKSHLVLVSLADIPQPHAWVSVSYCTGGDWFVKTYGPKPITRYTYASRKEAYKSKAAIDEFGCGGGCQGWHVVEHAWPKERPNKCYDIERKDYARRGGTIPHLYLIASDHKREKRIKEQTPPRASKQAQPGVVYILHAEGTERIKIGRSIVAHPRIEALQTASPFPLTILRTIPTQDIAQLERTLHKRYAPYRQHREWFTLPVPLLMALLEEYFD